ncbi:MAG: nucleotidyltransferase domain-containing protein [Natronospirillum sp.]|uniref:nucleotidyltransferase family protein n=1 Tax=Natronospirillum sp. TaxID=2812955 RepID=UPI0025F3E38C|nr:nucleotidyltransferase domain-containing protein [Natronospirillum sp.]MCH8553032.1 nucleotidyltransferase domain-containing protein [Natronospirillum sp.]
MLMDDISQKKDIVNQLAQQCGASHVRIFGSVARREETADSDIDILVELPKGYDLFSQRMRLAQSFEELFGRKVDLIPEHELNQYIRDDVIREAVPL